MDEPVRLTARPSGAGELFQFLRDGAPRTRAELAARTGQSRSTIAARVDGLLATGLIAPAGEAHSTGGRPPTTFAFNPRLRVVLAVDLGATHARLALTDLASEVLARSDSTQPIAEGPDAVLEAVITAGRDLVARAGRTMADLVAVGVGLPGPVEHSTGRPINPPIMPGWDDTDVPAILSAGLGTTVLVDNDVNIMALGEHRSWWPDVADMVFVKVGTGIGAGIISEGALHRGAQGSAGDIGHVAVPSGAQVPCRCGNLGCLEAIAGGRALAEALSPPGRPLAGSADVVALVRSGDVQASQVVRQAGRDIGSVLAAAVSLLNPSLVVIGGIIAEAGEHLIAGIREVVYQRSLPLATQHLRIVTSKGRQNAGVLGASAMALDHALSPAQVDALIG